jgi:hypothetical protein
MPIEPFSHLPRPTGMEHRAIALFAGLLITFGAWQVVKPKPKGIDDPLWKCEVSATLNQSECMRSSAAAQRMGLPLR